MNILIVRLSAVGDVVHTLPALHAIRAYFPDAHITWLVEESASGLVEGHQALNRVLISKRNRWIHDRSRLSCLPNIKEIYNFIKELRDTRYDLVIAFQTLLKTGILIALVKGKRKVGFDRGMEHMEHSYMFLNERVPPVNMNHHAIMRSLMLLEALGIPSNGIRYHLPVSAQDRDAANTLLVKHGIITSKLLVAINPVARWKTKLWSNLKFASLADQLIERYDVQIIFTGSREDRPIVQEIVSRMKRKAANLCGETTLKTLAALYERAVFLISPDTGPMHIAVAMETQVVALFGPTAPWRTGPFGDAHQIIRSNVECSPCFKRKCSTKTCMEQIDVHNVLDGISKLEVVSRLDIIGNKKMRDRSC